MLKWILLTGLLMQAHAYTFLSLRHCEWTYNGYEGIYRSMSGKIYVFQFNNYCPQTLTID